ncbi:MAG TPA: BON domain-containing protein [Thermoanaerobaculia bacterium]|nr:BON domain-containing protein [Thermoanaerobaculia bacterium]
MLLLVFSVVSCRSLSKGTPDEIDPEAIEASIRAQILAQYPTETFSLGIDVDRNGVVTLSGTVDNSTRRTKIGELARSVSGVTAVINNIRVG